MKVIYICSLFYQKNSSAAIRNFSLVSGLVNAGHDVHVVTVNDSTKDENEMFKNEKYRVTSYSIHSDVEKGGKGIVSKMLSVFPFLDSLKKKVVALLYFPDTHKKFIDVINYSDFEGYDVIISSSDTKSSHYAGEKMSILHKDIQWVQIWGDPWFADVTLDPVIKRYVANREKVLLSKGDKVIYVSEPTMKLCKELYSQSKEKMYFVPRSYLHEVYNLESFDIKNVKFLYTGGIANGRSLDAFFLWLERNASSVKESEFNYTININSDLSDERQSHFKQYKNINLNGVIPYDYVLREFEKNDVLLFVGNNLNATQIPGKLFDYMGTNLPVICIMHSLEEPVAQFLLRQSKCFVVTFEQLENDMIDLKCFLQFVSNRIAPSVEFSSQAIANKVIEIINK